MSTPLTPPPMTDEQWSQLYNDWLGKPGLHNRQLMDSVVAARDAQWQARVAELERDAERYRWLRDKGRYNNFSVEQDEPGWVTTHSEFTLDAAIDAARGEKGGV